MFFFLSCYQAGLSPYGVPLTMLVSVTSDTEPTQNKARRLLVQEIRTG